jgi:hypothetical protein
MTLQLSSRTISVKYLYEGPSGSSNDFEIPYASPEPWTQVRLDKTTLNNAGIPALSPNLDWCVSLGMNYVTTSGVDGVFDFDGSQAKLTFYDYRTSNAVYQRSTELDCTISGSAQLEIDSEDSSVIKARWKHDDSAPPPVGNYKFSLVVEYPDAKEQVASGFITVVL